MQLTTEDKERIEQEANEYGRKMSDDPLHPNVLAIFHFKPGAEYATIYEREQQVPQTMYANDTILKQATYIRELEAERSELIEKNTSLFNACEIREKELDELRNKVQQRFDIVNGLMQKMKSTLYWQERKEEKDFLQVLLNSLKK